MLATVSPLWGIAAAIITAAAGIAGQALVRLRESRDRRRDEYGRAFAAAMTWLEFPYRIARRVSDDDEVRGALVEGMHTNQEEIYYHQGWLKTASPEIGARYDELTATIKTHTRPHFAVAWATEGDPTASLAARFPVDTDAAVAAFVGAVRRDLSFWPRLFGTGGGRSGSAGGYQPRFQHLFLSSGAGVGTLVSLLLAAATALADGHNLFSAMVLYVIVGAPTLFWVARQRHWRAWLLLTSVEAAVLVTVTVIYGIGAGLLAVAAFAIALFARDLLLDGDRQRQGENPGDDAVHSDHDRGPGDQKPPAKDADEDGSR